MHARHPIFLIMALLLAGCATTPPPGAIEAAKKRLSSPQMEAVLGTVLDGPQLEDMEYRIERRVVSLILKQIKGLRREWLHEAADNFTLSALMQNPEDYRGKIIFAFLAVGELKPLWNDDLTLLIGGATSGEWYAYIYPRTRGRGRLYGGDFVWCTGVFVKAFRFRDGRGEEHRVPLFVGPYPSYTREWLPYEAAIRELGLEGFFPVKTSREPPPPTQFYAIDELGRILHGRQWLSGSEIRRRLEAVAEAASIRGEQGIVVLEKHPQCPAPHFNSFVETVSDLGLRLVVRRMEGGGNSNSN